MATTATTIATTMQTAPTAIAVSCQNWNGKSWTSRSVAGSNVYEPPAKNSRWKVSNSASNATKDDDAPDDEDDDQPDRPGADRPPRRHAVVASPAGAATRSRHATDDDGEGEEAR